MSDIQLPDDEIAKRLRLIAAVVTPSQGIRNDIIEVRADRVVLKSARTGRLREIPFRDLRQATRVSTNGVVVGVLARILGMDHGSEVETDAELESAATAPEHDALIQFYRDAKRWGEANSDWTRSITKYDLEKLTAQEFLGEYAWAVYVSAFKSRTVGKKWEALSKAWRGFDSQLMNDEAREEALTVIAHKKKADAIVSVAHLIEKMKWHHFKSQFCGNADSLGTLPWMGVANRRLVARNLGIGDVGKPDIWLRRLAAKFDFESVDDMLTVINKAVGDSPGVADLYLWAYLSDNPGALLQKDQDE